MAYSGSTPPSSQITGANRNIQVLRGLTTNRSLLSCTSDGLKVDLFSEDDNSGRQRWNIILVNGFNDVYNIIISGGVSSGRRFLSCTADGRVDLYDKDDGSGRQRWQFVGQKKNIPSYYQIKVVGGTNPNVVFLSCTADGLKVDLYTKDDGSGRQRWQLQ